MPKVNTIARAPSIHYKGQTWPPRAHLCPDVRWHYSNVRGAMPLTPGPEWRVRKETEWTLHGLLGCKTFSDRDWYQLFSPCVHESLCPAASRGARAVRACAACGGGVVSQTVGAGGRHLSQVGLGCDSSWQTLPSRRCRPRADEASVRADRGLPGARVCEAGAQVNAYGRGGVSTHSCVRSHGNDWCVASPAGSYGHFSRTTG